MFHIRTIKTKYLVQILKEGVYSYDGTKRKELKNPSCTC